jgi:AAA domain-containing protein
MSSVAAAARESKGQNKKKKQYDDEELMQEEQEEASTAPAADDWPRELPEGLRAISLEYVWSERVFLLKGGRELFVTLDHLLRHLGTLSIQEPDHYGDQVIGHRRLRVDIIVKEASLACWLGPEMSFDNFKFKGSGQLYLEPERVGNLSDNVHVNGEILNTMTHRCSGPCEWRGEHHDIPFADWAKAEAERSETELSQFMQLHDICNGDLNHILDMLDQYHRQPLGPQSYLVEGLIARGVVTLLLGKKGAGKTNIGLELAVDTAAQRDTWLGFSLKPNGGAVVYLYGEDSKEDVEERARTINGGKTPITLRLSRYDGRTIKEIVRELRGIKIDLIVIDPARKFYEGDEDGSDAVSSFFTKIENIADSKKAAVLVCHHLKRGSAPRDVHEVPNWMRGSQVFLDRPRTILALHRVGSKTTFGIPAPNGGDPLHNLKASRMFTGVRRLQRDESTQRHVPLDEQSKGDAKMDTSAEERVMVALKNLNAKGARVVGAKEHELFAWNPPELEGMSRAAVRKTVKSLIAAGRIIRDASGALAPRAE